MSPHSLLHLDTPEENKNKWMMHLYSTLLCIVVHPKHFYNQGGGGGGVHTAHHQCAASTWMINIICKHIMAWGH